MDIMPNVRIIICEMGLRRICNGETAVVWLNKLPGRGSYETVVGWYTELPIAIFDKL